MPNVANIDRPIILIGAGRSGTSLVSKVFDLHADCSTVGETANLIFGPWQAVALSSASVAPLVEDGAWVAEDDRAGRVVRQSFLTCFPDTKTHWMQKPIGVPKAVSDRFEFAASPEAAAWYWRVMKSSFPHARYMAILRHPCDAVLSGRSRWGFSDRSLWRTLAVLGSYLLHPDSPVQYVFRYETLIAQPERTVRELCDVAAMPFDAAMLGGFDEVHVPAPGREDLSKSGYTRRTEWATLDPAQITSDQRRTITNVFERFGGPIEWPDHFDSPRPDQAGAVGSEPPSELSVLRAQVGQLSARLERTMFDHAEELRRRDEAWQEREHTFFSKMQEREHAFAARERELVGLWSEQKAWIEDLERVKQWLQEQVENWKRLAQR